MYDDESAKLIEFSVNEIDWHDEVFMLFICFFSYWNWELIEYAVEMIQSK